MNKLFDTFNKVFFFVHDGVYCAHTGAGVHNFREIRILREFFAYAEINICPVFTSNQNPDFQPSWFKKFREIQFRDNLTLLEVHNGTYGTERYGDVNLWRIQVKNAVELIRNNIYESDRILVISVDTPFIGLISGLQDFLNILHIHIPNSSSILHDPKNHERLKQENNIYQEIPRNCYIGAICEFMRHHLTNEYQIPGEKIVSVQNGNLSEDYESPVPETIKHLQAKWLKDDTRKSIVSWGRATEYKGFHLLVSAMGALPREKFRLLINANADNENSLRYCRELQVIADEQNVDLTLHTEFDPYFPRFISQSELVNAIVVPSLSEPFGLIPSEVSFNKENRSIIIASDTGGLREQIISGKNGFSFSSGDVASLTRKLQIATSLSSSRRNDIILSARNLALRNYDLRKNFLETLNELSRKDDVKLNMLKCKHCDKNKE